MNTTSLATRPTTQHVFSAHLQDTDVEKAISLWKPHGAVLVADDEDIVCEITCELLKEQGFGTCYAACNGLEALSLYQEHEEQISLVMLDVSMPVLDGINTLIHLREISPNLPIVLSSGHNSYELMKQFSHDSHIHFLAKPYRAEAFQSFVQHVFST